MNYQVHCYTQEKTLKAKQNHVQKTTKYCSLELFNDKLPERFAFSLNATAQDY